jgi:hypothetical protein
MHYNDTRASGPISTILPCKKDSTAGLAMCAEVLNNRCQSRRLSNTPRFVSPDRLTRTTSDSWTLKITMYFVTIYQSDVRHYERLKHKL